MKNTLQILLATVLLSACASAPTPEISVVGRHIDSILAPRHQTNSKELDNGHKLYKVKTRIEPTRPTEHCTQPIEKDGVEWCTSDPVIPGSEITKSYVVDPKGIITDVSELSNPIEYTSSAYIEEWENSERNPEPELTPQQKESINDFYKNVHK